MLLISAEISLSPAEIAYEPNDGHLEIFEKVDLVNQNEPSVTKHNNCVRLDTWHANNKPL